MINIDSLKNKEARFNAMAFNRIMEERGLDDSFGTDFAALLSLSEKLAKVDAEHLAFFSDLTPEARALLSAADLKIGNLLAELVSISDKLNEVGIDAGKFLKNRQKRIDLSKDFAQKVIAMDQKLPSDLTIREISPFLGEYCE